MTPYRAPASMPAEPPAPAAGPPAARAASTAWAPSGRSIFVACLALLNVALFALAFAASPWLGGWFVAVVIALALNGNRS